MSLYFMQGCWKDGSILSLSGIRKPLDENLLDLWRPVVASMVAASCIWLLGM